MIKTMVMTRKLNHGKQRKNYDELRQDGDYSHVRTCRIQGNGNARSLRLGMQAVN